LLFVINIICGATRSFDPAIRSEAIPTWGDSLVEVVRNHVGSLFQPVFNPWQ